MLHRTPGDLLQWLGMTVCLHASRGIGLQCAPQPIGSTRCRVVQAAMRGAWQESPGSRRSVLFSGLAALAVAAPLLLPAAAAAAEESSPPPATRQQAQTQDSTSAVPAAAAPQAPPAAASSAASPAAAEGGPPPSGDAAGSSKLPLTREELEQQAAANIVAVWIWPMKYWAGGMFSVRGGASALPSAARWPSVCAQEEEERRKARRKKKGRIRELEEIRAELAEKVGVGGWGRGGSLPQPPQPALSLTCDFGKSRGPVMQEDRIL